MFVALFRQELRQLRLWVLLLIAFEALGNVALLLEAPPDQGNWAAHCASLLGEGPIATATAAWLLFLPVALSYSGFPRESDAGTLTFTFSLPVSRLRVFLAKLAAPALVLFGSVVCSELCSYLRHLPSQTSFGGNSFRPDWQLTVVFLSVSCAWIALAYGQLLAVFRRLGVLFAAGALLAAHWLESQDPRWVGISPFRLLHVDFEGSRPLLPWRALAGHAVAGLVSVTLAGAIWVGPLGRVAAAFRRLSSQGLVRVLVALAMVGLGVGASLLVYREAETEQSAAATTAGPRLGYGAPPRELLESPEQRLETEHFELRYPQALHSRVEPLASEVESIRRRLAERLEGAEDGPRIVLDMTRSVEHHAGSATEATIRLGLLSGPDPDHLQRVFAHELVHSLSQTASGSKLYEQGEQTTFFAEGLAEALSIELFPSTAQREALRLSAVLLVERHRLRFEDMARASQLAQDWGGEAIYALGETWVEAALSVCGPSMPTSVLRALARPDLPAGLAPEGLWQHLLQRSGCNLIAVNARWESELARAADELREALQAIPQLAGGAPRYLNRQLLLKIAPSQALRPQQVLFARARTYASEPIKAGSTHYASRSSGELYEVALPGHYEVEGSLQFQLGLHFEHKGHPVRYLAPWASARVAPASDAQ